MNQSVEKWIDLILAKLEEDHEDEQQSEEFKGKVKSIKKVSEKFRNIYEMKIEVELHEFKV